ncbi:MAG: transcription antitermination factor NusB [Spirochaetales bacterium]|nr:transcription antitermination factor NusB [Spirochaetales bacterium]
MKSRHLARSLAMQTLYALDFSGRFYDSEGKAVYATLLEGDIPLQGVSDSELGQLEQDVLSYSAFLLRGVIENMEQIDALISSYSVNRPLKRIDITDRNILRLSFFTLLYCPDVHPHIVIDEAVKLSQEFSTERSYKFVNGILDSYVRGEMKK